VLVEGCQDKKDLFQILQTHLGLWVSIEKQTADMLAKLGLKDGILQVAGDTVDALDFDHTAETIKELSECVES